MKSGIKLKTVTRAGVIAALYVLLNLVSSMMGLSSGGVQIRLSEALCILPCFSVAAIPGLFVGCLAANIISGIGIFDVILGSLATLIGASGTYLLRKDKYISVIPPILSNALIVPLVLVIYGADMSYPVMFLLVMAGEVVSCGLLGLILHNAISKVMKSNKHF